MSRCYCSEISKCKDNIKILNKNISAVARCKTDQLSSDLEQVKIYSVAFYTASRSELNSSVLELHDDLESARGEIRDKMISKRDELQQELSRMEQEDEEYHKEEEDEDAGEF